jgi:O-antigen chain-terminating methyltransferase
LPEDKVIEAIKKEIEELRAAKRDSGSPACSSDFTAALQWVLGELAANATVDINRIPVRSTRPVWGPLITLFKRAVRKSTYWLYQPLFEQISRFNHAAVRLLNELSATKQHWELEELRCRIDSCWREVALLTTKPAEPLNQETTASASTAFQAENAKTQLTEIASQHQAWIYYAFEQQFRGPEELIKERQQAYISDVQKAYQNCGGYVLDLGAGRGEFLELCREAGIPAKGVDLNKAMVARCREKGLEVEKADGLAYLLSLPVESLCALTAFQVVEHLPPETLWQLVQTALLKLKPGGLIILETVNPDSLVAFKNFYLDLTHQKPIPSATLCFILEAAGFRQVEIRFSAPVPKEMQLIERRDENIKKLNELLFGPMVYAAVGTK